MDKQRPLVLSVGLQQLKQDMRYRVKVVNINNEHKQSKSQNSNEPLAYQDIDMQYVFRQSQSIQSGEDFFSTESGGTNEFFNRNKYLIQNWQFEIRKLTYEDAGIYQCLLPLVKPIAKNVTLQVIPDLIIEPKEGNYKIDDRILIKCKATLKIHHRHGSSHNKNQQHIHQRQSKPSINWYRDNELLKMDPKKQLDIITKQDHDENLLHSTLVIHKAKLEDSGKYRCIYDNIQEQIPVKVTYEYYGYNNYLTSSAIKSTRPVNLFLANLVLLISFYSKFYLK